MQTSFIYIIGSNKPPYKVGISKNPNRRLKNLQTGHPYPLQIHHLIETNINKTKLLETIIHRNLKFHKTNGEWFDMSLQNLKLQVEFVLIRYGEEENLSILVKERII